MSCPLPSSTTSAEGHIMLLLLLHLVLPPAVHHHCNHSRCHHHPPIGIAHCCMSPSFSCHFLLCFHLPLMLRHLLYNCPLPPLAVVILPAASTVVASHLPSSPLSPLPPPSSSPVYSVLFDCYPVLSVGRCLSYIVHCLCCLPSAVVSCPHLPLLLLKIFATAGLKG